MQTIRQIYNILEQQIILKMSGLCCLISYNFYADFMQLKFQFTLNIYLKIEPFWFVSVQDYTGKSGFI